MKKILVCLCAALGFVYSIFACTAITAKGTVCKRSGHPYCWQHKHLEGKSATSSTTAPKSTSTVKTPKSYEVYKSRTSQGSRSFTPAMRKKMYEKQGGICAHCHQWFPLDKMDADHIVPYSKGGTTTESNCQMLCQHCNRSKGNKGSY